MKVNTPEHVGFESPTGQAWKGMKRVQHLCIEANALDDVGIACDVVQEPKVPVRFTLDCNQMCTCVSFCARSPSGFEIEFDARGERLGEDFVQRDLSNSEFWAHKRLIPRWAPTGTKNNG